MINKTIRVSSGDIITGTHRNTEFLNDGINAHGVRIEGAEFYDCSFILDLYNSYIRASFYDSFITSKNWETDIDMFRTSNCDIYLYIEGNLSPIKRISLGGRSSSVIDGQVKELFVRGEGLVQFNGNANVDFFSKKGNFRLEMVCGAQINRFKNGWKVSGFDGRGYDLYVVPSDEPDGSYRYLAGCRFFTYEEALAHWQPGYHKWAPAYRQIISAIEGILGGGL